MSRVEENRAPKRRENQSEPWTLKVLGGKTRWEWLELLVVPFALTCLTVGFTMYQGARQDAIEDRRAKAERTLTEQRAQDDALQAYFAQMGTLLLDKDLRASPVDSEVRTLARARTLTVLNRVDQTQRTSIIRFLSEASLVQSKSDPSAGPWMTVPGPNPFAKLLGDQMHTPGDVNDAILKDDPVVSLSQARVGGLILEDADLRGADLRGADLSGADLSGAELTASELADADLSRADLRATSLGGANLAAANLAGADLRGAYVAGANLSDADLADSRLDGANFWEANLRDAEGLAAERLDREAKSLTEAIMPDGQKYEDWRKEGSTAGENG